jgi:hypothetical protein
MCIWNKYFSTVFSAAQKNEKEKTLPETNNLLFWMKKKILIVVASGRTKNQQQKEGQVWRYQVYT